MGGAINGMKTKNVIVKRVEFILIYESDLILLCVTKPDCYGVVSLMIMRIALGMQKDQRVNVKA